MPLVFVYGTLRKGEHNNHLLASSKFVGEATSVQAKYWMACDHTVPFLHDGGHSRVVGEIWRVDGPIFKRLDQLEGHPHLYCRVRRTFQLQNGERVAAWVYIAQEAYAQKQVKPAPCGCLAAPRHRSAFRMGLREA